MLTERGRDFRPVLVALFAWGNRHFAPEGASVLLVDRQSGAVAEPMLVDANSGWPLSEDRFGYVPGPAAGERTRQRLAARAASHRSATQAPEETHGPAKRSRGRRRS